MVLLSYYTCRARLWGNICLFLSIHVLYLLRMLYIYEMWPLNYHLQEFLQRVAKREPEVLRYKTLRLTVHNQPPELHEASEIKKEHQLLHDHWIKLQQLKQTWGELLNSCEAAWESCLATERKLRLLEDVHAKWEPPAENQDILLQLKEIEVSLPLFI